MILLVRTNSQQEILIDIETINTVGLQTSVRSRIMPVDREGKQMGYIDLNDCRVELLPNG